MTENDRFNNHNETILNMLRKGPVTNVAIAQVSKNHTARISNLRKSGHDIRCKFVDRKTGLTEYRLVTQVQETAPKPVMAAAAKKELEFAAA